MKATLVFVAALGVLASGRVVWSAAAEQAGPSDIAAADTLFVAGKFAEANRLYAQIVAKDPKQHLATLRLGYIALMSNQFDEAEKRLSKAIDLKPNDADAKGLLAEAYYRQDEFQKAVPLLRSIGQEAKARKLASLKGVTPYRLQGSGESTSVKFLMTDPLPLIQVRVNGGQDVNFFLDTGASEVVLDTEFARELGVVTFGSEEGTFAGGKKAAVQHGRIDSLTLGAWTVRNVPVAILDTRQFAEIFDGRQVDGAIGTVLFYHFIATMDYPQGELVLRRKTAANRRPFEVQSTKSTAVPFWMAGDHFMVAWGKVDQREPVLLFVDTGVARAGAKLTESVIRKAGIQLLEDQASEGVGAGGGVRSVPFRLKELSLGQATQKNIVGLFEGPFPWEHSFGFKLDGMIGHDFFKPYAVTFDFDGMRIILKPGP